MTRYLWLFGFLLGIPLVGFAVGQSIRGNFDSEFRSAVQSHYPDADPGRVRQLTLDWVCETQDQSLSDVCSTNSHLHFMRVAAMWSGVIGLGLLLAIQIASHAARSNRELLLRL